MKKVTICFVVLIAVGLGYGYLSALRNVNRNPVRTVMEMPPEDLALVKIGKAWRPSPLWLPSYIVCTVPQRHVEVKMPAAMGGASRSCDIVGFGLTSVNGEGYSFSTRPQRLEYQVASTIAGGAMGLILASIIAVAAGWVPLWRRKPAPPSA